MDSVGDCLTLSNASPEGRPGIVAALERCRALLPNDSELMADLGSEYESGGKFEQAEDIYREALAIDPDYADLRLRLAGLMLRRGEADGAVAQAELALRTQPNRKAVLAVLDQARRAGKRP